jgi:hypothetical protein
VNEKISIKESEIKELYDKSNGDIRFILNSLQFSFSLCRSNTLNIKKNIQSINIFESTGKLLSLDESFDNKYNTYWLSNNLHLLMIQENYINNTFGIREDVKKLSNLSYSADSLSDADIFETYVNMTNWEFEPYVASSIINAASKCNKKTMIKFPQFLGRTSTMYKNKRDKINYNDIKFLDDKVVSNPKKTTEEVKRSKPRGRPKKVK